MRTTAEHLERVTRATDLYVAAHNERNNVMIEAAMDGCTVMQLAEAALLPPAAVARILGHEWPEGDPT